MNKIPFKKIGEIRSELKQLNGLDWYTKHSIAQELIKEAGWKENIFSGLLAAVLMVLNGTTVEAASRKTNVRQQEILSALQDEDTVNKAINIWKTTPNEEKQMSKGKIKQPKQLNTSIQTPTQAPSGIPSFDTMYNFIKSNEGYKTKVYKDPAGNLAIGLGFNLDRSLAKTLFKNMGIDYNDVRQGRRILTEKEIRSLFQYDLNLAINNAKRFVNNFDSLPHDAKMVLIDMSYNMGFDGLNKFQEFKKALEQNNFRQAAREMEDSKWFAQVKSRGEKLVGIMDSISSVATTTPIIPGEV